MSPRPTKKEFPTNTSLETPPRKPLMVYLGVYGLIVALIIGFFTFLLALPTNP